jgi:hypothetical protein
MRARPTACRFWSVLLATTLVAHGPFVLGGLAALDSPAVAGGVAGLPVALLERLPGPVDPGAAVFGHRAERYRI